MNQSKNLNELDLEWQYVMLAHHVSEFLEEVVHYDVYGDGDGIYPVCDVDLEPMKKRLSLIEGLRYSETSQNDSINEEL